MCSSSAGWMADPRNGKIFEGSRHGRREEVAPASRLRAALVGQEASSSTCERKPSLGARWVGGAVVIGAHYGLHAIDRRIDSWPGVKRGLRLLSSSLLGRLGRRPHECRRAHTARSSRSVLLKNAPARGQSRARTKSPACAPYMGGEWPGDLFYTHT